MKTNKISISEDEYRDYIRLKVSNEELEKITQKRIDEAVKSETEKKDKEIEELKQKSEAEYNKLIDDVQHKRTITIESKEIYNSVFSGTIKDISFIYFIDGQDDLDKLIKDNGLDNIFFYSCGGGFSDIKGHVQYKGTTYYSLRGIKELEYDIESLINRKNELIDDIKLLGKNSSDVITSLKEQALGCYRKEDVKEKQKTIIARFLSNLRFYKKIYIGKKNNEAD